MSRIFLVGLILMIASICCGTTATNQLENDQLTTHQEKASEEGFLPSPTKITTPKIVTTKIQSMMPDDLSTAISYTPTEKHTGTITPTQQPSATITSTPGTSLQGIYLLYLSTTELQFKEYMEYV